MGAGTGAVDAPASLTPRARTTAGGFGGGQGGGAAATSSPMTVKVGGVVSAVAEAAMETADEEDAKRQGVSGGGGGGGGRGGGVGDGGGSNRRAGGGGAEEPPSMQGASLPARLAVPQLLASPVSPSGGDGLSRTGSATAGGGGVIRGRVGAGSGGGGSGPVGGVVDVGAANRADLLINPNTAMLSPNAVMLSPGTDSDRGSTPSPGALARPDLFGVGAAGVGGEGRRGAGGAAGAAAAAGRRAAEVERPFSPWVTSKAGAWSGGAFQRREGGDKGGGTRVGDRVYVGEAHTLSISPASAGSSSVGSSLWRASGPRGENSFSTNSSMGGAGAEEARGGLMAARAGGKKRALGALDLMQVSFLLSVAQKVRH